MKIFDFGHLALNSLISNNFLGDSESAGPGTEFEWWFSSKRPVPNIPPALQLQLYYAASVGSPFT